MRTAIARVLDRLTTSDPLVINEGRYTVRLARDRDEIDDALQLRYKVFNLELGEGIASSHITGLDEDEFDERCDHLIAIDNESGDVVGTYRLQTLEAAKTADRFYCSTEYDLAALPLDVLRNGLEIGRACIAKEHRHTKVLYLLWKGLARVLESRNKKYLFGCCSLTTQNRADGVRAFVELEEMGVLDRDMWAEPRKGYDCRIDDSVVYDDGYELPKLFKAYLKLGAKVCSPPAIDRSFGTIDFLVIFDIGKAPELAKRMFLS